MRGEENATSQIKTVPNWSELIQEAGQTFDFKIVGHEKSLRVDLQTIMEKPRRSITRQTSNPVDEQMKEPKSRSEEHGLISFIQAI